MKWQTLVFLMISFLALYMVARIVRDSLAPRGRPPKPVVELDQLQIAMQSYKEKHLQYPPCMAESHVQNRKVQFMRHVQVAFTNSGYGTSSADFDRLNTSVQTGSRGGLGYNHRNDANEQFVPLDLNRLDAAESLVFWLGGFPTPFDVQSGKAVVNSRIFCFHRDSETPFHRDSKQAEANDPLRYRSQQFYLFDEIRLVDYDNDGWLEYIPSVQRFGEFVAPFVYFDAKTYRESATSRDWLGTVRYPGAAELAKQVGYAVPYAKHFDPSTFAMTWYNPESFQIVCGGQDGVYDADPSAGLRRVAVVPEGSVYRLPNIDETSMSSEENDNWTNLSRTAISQMKN